MLFEKKPKGKLFLVGKTLSFCLALGLFAAMLGLILFNREWLKENIFLAGGTILGIIIITVVFPRAIELLKKNALSEGMKAGSLLFAEKINRAITWVLLSITYILGVGIVFLLSRIFKKRFLQLKPKGNTFWIDKKKAGKDEDMF